ncbi:putative Bracovirus protein MdBV-1-18 [Microplitis demolitor]
MDIIIDFNGCFLSDKKYIIKEYSLFHIDKKSCHITSDHHNVSKPEFRWEELESRIKNMYQLKYYKHYGIHWNTGSKSHRSILNSINTQMLFAEHLYVRTSKQRQLLIDHIISDFNKCKIINIKCLDYLGYTIKPKESTICKYHDEPKTYNCAHDNLVSMTRWLKASNLYKIDYRSKMHIVIDFIGHLKPNDLFAIKEFYMVALNEFFMTTNVFYSLLKHPIDFNKLPMRYQLDYQSFYDQYGIRWSSGVDRYQDFKLKLRNYIVNSTFIYVRNSKLKNILENIIGNDYNIICLDKFGYNIPPKMSTQCSSHDRKDRNNCPCDNLKHMKNWLEFSNMYKASLRYDYMDTLSNKVKDYVQKIKIIN